MKIKLYLILSFLFCFTACKKDNVDSIKSSTGITYRQSLGNWQSFKQSVHNNYNYVIISGSVFGFGSETKITVQSGVVTGRYYTAYAQVPGTGNSTVTQTWNETTPTLNTHTQGATTLTMDDIYNKANSVWLKADKKSNTIYFETDSKGLISSCGFVPNGCQDDCFNGVTIKEIIGL